MIFDPLKLDDAIQILNRLVAADSQAIWNLIENRVYCNDTLANDPTCQVSDGGDGNSVGLLGVLNGLFGTYDSGPKKGWGPITAVFDDHEQILYGFRKTMIPGFMVRGDLPPDIKAEFEVFLADKTADAYTICENDIGFFLFSLGREGLEDPVFAVSKDL